MAAASSLVSLLEGHVAGSTLAQEAQSAGGALLNILISVTLLSANYFGERVCPGQAVRTRPAG